VTGFYLDKTLRHFYFSLSLKTAQGKVFHELSSFSRFHVITHPFVVNVHKSMRAEGTIQTRLKKQFQSFS